MKKLFVLLLISVIVLPLYAAFAQETALTQEFQSATGLFTISYPEGWVVVDEDSYGNVFQIFNSQAAYDHYQEDDDSLLEGEIALYVSILPSFIVPDELGGVVGPDASAEEVWTALGEEEIGSDGQSAWVEAEDEIAIITIVDDFFLSTGYEGDPASEVFTQLLAVLGSVKFIGTPFASSAEVVTYQNDVFKVSHPDIFEVAFEDNTLVMTTNPAYLEDNPDAYLHSGEVIVRITTAPLADLSVEAFLISMGAEEDTIADLQPEEVSLTFAELVIENEDGVYLAASAAEVVELSDSISVGLVPMYMQDELASAFLMVYSTEDALVLGIMQLPIGETSEEAKQMFVEMLASLELTGASAQ